MRGLPLLPFNWRPKHKVPLVPMTKTPALQSWSGVFFYSKKATPVDFALEACMMYIAKTHNVRVVMVL